MTHQTPQERIGAIVDEWFYGDFDDAADAIRDILEAIADRVEEAEPYATRTIGELRKVAGNMYADDLEGTV